MEGAVRNFHWFTVGIGGVLGVVGLLGWSAFAQAPPGLAPAKPAPAATGEINPPVANCNVTPDTNQPATPRATTPIVPKLLTSGQPCQQVVSTKGLNLPDDPAVTGLSNLQRGFDFYSWLTFIAMNSPADGKPIGKGPRPGGDALTQWESVNNYRPLADVMLSKGAKPTWGTRIVPELCKALDGPGKIVFQLGEEAFNQPFKSGPLIDQDGNFALFDILMNHPMFDFIDTNGLYSKQGQQKYDKVVEFPSGNVPGTDKDGKPIPGRMGAIMLKVSYRILDPEKNKDLLTQFHTSDALIFFPGPPATKAGPACVAKKLGLIGFHVGHKTNFAPQWVWSSFEHVSNAPDEANIGTSKMLPRYNFYKGGCNDCAVNDVPPQPWDPETSLKFATPYKSQVVRTKMVPTAVLNEVADLNQQFQALLKGTVWENYMLLTTQWPSDHASKTDPNGAPAPTYLANTTLETYSQGRVPLASSSCMACHGNATTQHIPATASDFTFILEKAQEVR
jgi:hypothetical protein